MRMVILPQTSWTLLEANLLAAGNAETWWQHLVP
jgi:hypothetical protein